MEFVVKFNWIYKKQVKIPLNHPKIYYCGDKSFFFHDALEL